MQGRGDRSSRRVHPISGAAGYYAVQSSTGDTMYLIHLHDDGTACCSCPDYQDRQSKVDAPCKHILASELYRDRPVPKPAAPAAAPKPKRGKAATADEPSAVAFYTAELERVTAVAKATAARVERGEATGDDYTEAVREVRKVRKHLEDALATAGAAQPAMAA